MSALVSSSTPCQLDELLFGFAPATGIDLETSDICQDSRQLSRGSIFLAVQGAQAHGADYIDEAIARGASAVLVDLPQQGKLQWRDGVPIVPVNGLAEHASEIAGRLFGNPSRSLWVAGVTGTNGKTSCAWWLQQLLNSCGVPSASLGTLGIARARQVSAQADGLTTSDAVSLQRKLAQLRAEGLESVAIEVSSHGLAQHRVDGIAFDLAIFTNLSQDHLDYHGDLASYAKAKARLFDLPGVGHSLINIDDEFGRQLFDSLPRSMEIYTYSLCNADADFYALSNNCYPALSAEISTPWGDLHLNNPAIFGAHNLANLIGVAAAALIKGVALSNINSALLDLSPVPGRMQRVSADRDSVEVIVDFAHTPDAVSKTLASLAQTTRGRLWVLLGAGGDRDRSKRPLMAQAAMAYADRLTITSDNPRGEDAAAIAQDLMSGLATDASAEIVLDRGEAIAATIAHAESGDCVAILGKGHESYQIIGNQKLPFSDVEVAAKALADRRESEK